MQYYYDMPLLFRAIIRGEHLFGNASVEKSIQQHIAVLLLSAKGDWRFDSGYGCELWDMNFESDPEIKRRLQNLEHSIKLLLEKYERRLHQPEVRVTPDDRILNFFDNQGEPAFMPQKRISVQVSGTLAEDGRHIKLAPVELIYRPR